MLNSLMLKDFAGVCGVSALNSPMFKRAFGVAGFLALCFPLAAQQPFDSASTFIFYRPEIVTSVDSSDLLRELPMAKFLDGRLPGSTALGRMGTAPVANFPMALVNAEPRKKGNSVSGPVRDPKDGKDYSSTELLAVEKASLAWTGGEIGFMYGHSSGKFGGDEFTSYITGGVGNEHLQINVGASYQEFNGRLPRWRP
jgi:hypothetical protein